MCPKICEAVTRIKRKVYQYFADINRASSNIIIQVNMYPIEVDCNEPTPCYGSLEYQIEPICPARIHQLADRDFYYLARPRIRRHVATITSGWREITSLSCTFRNRNQLLDDQPGIVYSSHLGPRIQKLNIYRKGCHPEELNISRRKAYLIDLQRGMVVLCVDHQLEICENQTAHHGDDDPVTIGWERSNDFFRKLHFEESLLFWPAFALESAW